VGLQNIENPYTMASTGVCGRTASRGGWTHARNHRTHRGRTHCDCWRQVL